MVQLLLLQTSLFGDNGASNQLAQRFIAQLQSSHPALPVAKRDLNAEHIPHLTMDAFSGFGLNESERNANQKKAAQLSDKLIDELQQSDTIVLGLPLYNFGAPSTLKSWIDYVTRPGITFRYTENGPEGLIKGKKLYIIATRGGQYVGTPADTQTEFIRTFFNFIGITDVEFIYAEGLAINNEVREQSLTQAANLLKQKAVA